MVIDIHKFDDTPLQIPCVMDDDKLSHVGVVVVVVVGEGGVFLRIRKKGAIWKATDLL